MKADVVNATTPQLRISEMYGVVNKDTYDGDTLTLDLKQLDKLAQLLLQNRQWLVNAIRARAAELLSQVEDSKSNG